ncbi:MAG: type VI secretion system baseplate subunit TssF [Candidatus Omnitrophica bacterium]|nr:type VI secretion system baseplate subunit TssF [Candidatus Omnitrophota bacterium]MCP5251538.1 type VI secretion system baseplate subunit TssF [Burkholderiales bacterium]
MDHFPYYESGFLKYYERELRFIREMGAEFSKQYPEIAAYLNLGTVRSADPYIERLLEGFAFLTARIQLKMDAEYPKFTQYLLEIVYPHYLAPLPSMMIVQIEPNPGESFTLDKSTKLLSKPVGNRNLRCEFLTTRTIKILPIEITEATYLSRDEINKYDKVGEKKIKSGIRIRLKTSAEIFFSQLTIDQLSFYLYGIDGVPEQLYELIVGHAKAVVVGDLPDDVNIFDKSIIHPLGFDQEETMLPATAQAFAGYHLLQEYFAFPQQFLFFQIKSLSSVMPKINKRELDIVILFDESKDNFGKIIDKENFKLNCTPAINLFEMRTSVHVDKHESKQRIVMNKSASDHYEIYSLLEVTGVKNNQEKQNFFPFYSDHRNNRTDSIKNSAYFTINRKPTVYSGGEKSNERDGYVGNDVYISLVSHTESIYPFPYDEDIEQLRIRALCTNRGKSKLLTSEIDKLNFSWEVEAPINRIRCIAGPTNPKSSNIFIKNKKSHRSNNFDDSYVKEGLSWRLINHLSLNYLSLVNNDQQHGAEVLREMFKLYADFSEDAIAKQIEGLLSVESRPITCRVPIKGPITFGRGLEITLTFDESVFAGRSCFLFGAILDQFFRKYASINNLTQVRILTIERGEIMRWPVRTGTRALL